MGVRVRIPSYPPHERKKMKKVIKYILESIAVLVCVSPFFIIIFALPIIGFCLATPDNFWIAAIAPFVWVFPAMYIFEKISKHIDRAIWYLLEKIEKL